MIEDDPPEDAPEDHWAQMPVAGVALALGGIAGIIVPLYFLTTTSMHGWGLLWAIPLIWVGFAFVVGLGAPISIVISFVIGILLIPFQDDVRDKVFLLLRWLAMIAGSGILIIGGGSAIFDGWTNNRMQPAQALYERCMQPVTTTRTHRYETCADGWRSPSIGRSGACSHHGGVVQRTVKRTVTEPPHSSEHCRIDSSRRSWLD